jgi:hypothetical protein
MVRLVHSSDASLRNRNKIKTINFRNSDIYLNVLQVRQLPAPRCISCRGQETQVSRR